MDENDQYEMYYLDVASPGAEKTNKKKRFYNAINQPILYLFMHQLKEIKEWLGV